MSQSRVRETKEQAITRGFQAILDHIRQHGLTDHVAAIDTWIDYVTDPMIRGEMARLWVEMSLRVTLATYSGGMLVGFLGFFVGADCPASSALTQERLGWRPTSQPGLIEDLDHASAFETSPSN